MTGRPSQERGFPSLAGSEAKSNTALFLMELIVVICFFSLVAVVCVRLFVAASVESRRSVDVARAAGIAESLAEAWGACGGDLGQTAALFSAAAPELEGADAREGSLTLAYDADWQRTARREGAAYLVTLTGRLLPATACYPEAPVAALAVQAEIAAVSVEDGKPIAALSVDRYLGEVTGR